MRNIKIRTEAYFFETLPTERRLEIVNEALASQLHAVIAGSATVDAFVRGLRRHSRWAFLRHLPIASLLHVAAQYGEAAAAASRLSNAASNPQASNSPADAMPTAATEHAIAAPVSHRASITSSPPAAMPRATRSKRRRASAKQTTPSDETAPSATGRASKKSSEQSTNGLEQKLLGAIRATPGIRVGDLLTKVGGDKGKMKQALATLRDDGKVTATGIKRGMVYSLS